MRKVLFLMFLLLLMGLGAAGVKAQVRIGGNTAPSAAAVLDLNATDAANAGTGGLVLPRVNLTSNTMPLTTGVANVTGTMVYDVTTTLGNIGVYYWNGAKWVLASLPSTSSQDSGLVLIETSTGTMWSSPFPYSATAIPATMNPRITLTSFSAVDLIFAHGNMTPGTVYHVNATGLTPPDVCIHSNDLDYVLIIVRPAGLDMLPFRTIPANPNATVRCFRFS